MQPQDPQRQFVYVQAPPPPQKGWFRRQGCFVQSLIVIGVLILIGAVIDALDKGSTSAGANPTATAQQSGPTATPKPAPKPKVVLDLSGSGIKSSPTFNVQGSSQLLKWTCDPNSFSIQGFNVIGTLYNAADKSIDSVPLNELCGTGSGQSTGDTTTLHLNAGSYYLEMNSEGSWHVTITDQP